MKQNKIITTSAGRPVECDFASLTAGPCGPTLLQDTYMMEKLSHFNNEATLPRAMHTKGAGAHGIFRATNDLSAYTCADFLSHPGKETEIFTRFSQAVGGRDSIDTTRNIRGFAIKFYTNEGNYDILSITVPAFFVSDIMKFPDFVHSLQGLAKNDLKDPNTSWDFFSLNPETVHAVSLFYTDRATPASYLNIDTFGPNTFLWYNRAGERFLVKYHFLSKQGRNDMTAEEATKIGGENPDYLRKDLYESLDKGACPVWEWYVQIMPEQEAKHYEYDPYDVTQIWLHKDYPLIKVGDITLTANPDNFFNEVEQSAFAVHHFVPGIDASNDKLLQGRLFVYQNAQDYRLGVNRNQLPINSPKVTVSNFERNGYWNIDTPNNGDPNYNPNSEDNIIQTTCCTLPPEKIDAKTGRYFKTNLDKTFEQTGMLYDNVLCDKDKEHLVHNLVLGMQGVKPKFRYRQVALFYKASKEYGTAIANALCLEIDKVADLAAMDQRERICATQDW